MKTAYWKAVQTPPFNNVWDRIAASVIEELNSKLK